MFVAFSQLEESVGVNDFVLFNARMKFMRLRAPFAVFATTSAASINNRTGVHCVAAILFSDAVGGIAKSVEVGILRYVKRLFGSQRRQIEIV